MPTETNSLKDIIDLIKSIKGEDKSSSSLVLSESFKVNLWSREYYFILSCIVERFDHVKSIINKVVSDESVRKTNLDIINRLSNIFTSGGQRGNWKQVKDQFIVKSNIDTITNLSLLFDIDYKYKVPDEEEVKEIIKCIDSYLEWLKSQDLDNYEFIKQIMIEGLSNFKFRLERLKWIGIDNTLESIKDAMTAYFSFKGVSEYEDENPKIKATIKKFESVMKPVFDTLKILKDVSDVSGWALGNVKAIALLVYSNDAVSGLLTHFGR